MGPIFTLVEGVERIEGKAFMDLWLEMDGNKEQNKASGLAPVQGKQIVRHVEVACHPWFLHIGNLDHIQQMNSVHSLIFLRESLRPPSPLSNLEVFGPRTLNICLFWKGGALFLEKNKTARNARQPCPNWVSAHPFPIYFPPFYIKISMETIHVWSIN